MLVVQGFFENGVFTPNEPVMSVKGRQEATLTIKEHSEKRERQKQKNQWTDIIKALQTCDEELKGEPEKVHFKTPEEIDAL